MADEQKTSWVDFSMKLFSTVLSSVAAAVAPYLIAMLLIQMLTGMGCNYLHSIKRQWDDAALRRQVWAECRETCECEGGWFFSEPPQEAPWYFEWLEVGAMRTDGEPTPAKSP